jgi:hypothetical protein
MKRKHKGSRSSTQNRGRTARVKALPESVGLEKGAGVSQREPVLFRFAFRLGRAVIGGEIAI